MAPNFLSKLVKPSSKDRNSARERVSSESSRPSGFNLSLSRNRSQSTSIGSGGSNAVNSPSTPTQASTLNSKKRNNYSGDNRIPSIVTTLAANGSSGHVSIRKSLDSVTTVSTQPNVTIVPPSPRPHNAELDSEDDEDEQPVLPPITVGKEPEEPEDVATPTPTPTVPKKQQPIPTPPPAEPPMSTSLAPGTHSQEGAAYRDQHDDCERKWTYEGGNCACGDAIRRERRSDDEAHHGEPDRPQIP
ncbi:hypothetical protein NLJ89_g11663 [Agrocybe chaxingu]|uniref:Uncharacterized protein n=1 Tax=Agrocybe chaxingu TaxID=84603 RepID=A0A9W8MRE6_9AGAR|nr:hypothetical protein NLJ89_g11663 [Agrocybe chaxingu]